MLMKKCFLLFLVSLFLASCGGRIPSPETAQDIIKDHLNDYGKKYPDSIFGNRKVQKVDIVSIEELQRKLATAIAMVGLDNGTAVKIQMNFLHKAPLGWRSQGWENLGAENPSVPSSSPLEGPIRPSEARSPRVSPFDRASSPTFHSGKAPPVAETERGFPCPPQ